MFGQIANIWKGEPLMKKVIEKFGEMLSQGEYVFNRAWEIFLAQTATEQEKQELFAGDAAINNYERAIRKILVEHLSLRPGHDVSGALVMMSMVKDAERIGDYSKNIFEVGIICEEKIKNMKYLDRLSSIQRKIADHFPQLKKAFLESDENLAEKLLMDYAPIKSECNNVLRGLFSEQLSTCESVSTALVSRYLKRVNSHMSNIASGIIYPLDQIDFVQGDILE